MSIGISTYASAQTTIKLWPGAVPGETAPRALARVSPDSSRQVQRLTDVTDPLLQVYIPAVKNRTGVGVIVCPGGGYSILAWNLEGEEIARWLNSLGYTAFVLQYRVPQKETGALQDLQRALRIVKERAAGYDLRPESIGVMGFSAGGSLSARAATQYNRQTYTPVDKADSLSCRPAFAMLIYPAYLDKGPNRTLTPELTLHPETPPMFLFATADDTYGNSALVMAGALRDAKVPAELHFYAQGGHGYGLRPGNPAADVWPGLAATWLKTLYAHR